MSALPEIDYKIVSHRLTAQVSELVFQKIQLEVLAESLRDERDKAFNDADSYKARLDSLQKSLEESEARNTETKD